jgi:putative transcriptional regulator
VPLDEGILFDAPVDERWEKAYALLGLTPAVGMSMRTVGSA